MKMEKGHRWGQWLAIALMVALAAVLPGCGKMSEKVPGIWKSAEAKDGKHDYVEIGTNSVVLDEERIEGAVLEDKDTSVWVKTPFTGNEALMVVIANDDGSLTCQLHGLFGGKPQKFVRSTAEERSAELTPPLAAFRGFAKATGKFDGATLDELWEIGDGFVIRDVQRVPATLSSGKRRYTLTLNPGADGEKKLEFNAVSAAKDEFEASFEGFMGGGYNVRLKKVSAEEGAAMRAQREKIFAEKKELLEKIKGHWLECPTKPQASKTFFEEKCAYPLIISKDELIANNIKGDICIEVSANEAVFRYDPKKYRSYSNQKYIVKSLSEDGATMRVLFVYGGGTKEIEYQRMKESEEKRICNPELKQFFGKWVLDAAPCEVFKTLDISLSAVSFDGEKHPIKEFDHSGSGIGCNIQFSGEHIINNYMLLRYLPGDRIAVGYPTSCEKIHYTNERNICYYRKASDDEYRNIVTQAQASLLSALTGYWKSDETKVGDDKLVAYCKFNYAPSTNPDNGSPIVSHNWVICRSEYGEKPYKIVNWSDKPDCKLCACLAGGDTKAKVYFMAHYYYMAKRPDYWSNYNIQIINANAFKVLSVSNEIMRGDPCEIHDIVMKRADKKDMGPYFEKFPE